MRLARLYLFVWPHEKGPRAALPVVPWLGIFRVLVRQEVPVQTQQEGVRERRDPAKVQAALL